MATERCVSRVVAGLRYREPERAAAWLCEAFGFVRHDERSEPTSGVIALRYGQDLIMVLPIGRSDLDVLMTQPDEIGGKATQSCYLVVEDIEAHLVRAQSAGAFAIGGLKTFESGGRGYTCCDLEGHLWNFGTYDPWVVSVPDLDSSTTRSVTTRMHPGRVAFTIILFALLAGATVWGLQQLTFVEETLSARVAGAKAELERLGSLVELRNRQLSDANAAASALEARERQAREQLVKETALAQELKRALGKQETAHADEQRSRVAAERALAAAELLVASHRSDREAAQRKAVEAQEELVETKAELARAEQAAKDATKLLDIERAARDAEGGMSGSRPIHPQDENKTSLRKTGTSTPPAKKSENSAATRPPAPSMPPLIP